MSDDYFRAPISPIRSSWSETRMLMRGRLTDKKIASYQRRGFYDQSVKDMRRELYAKRKAKRDEKRIGNFVKTGDGRLIYSPI